MRGKYVRSEEVKQKQRDSMFGKKTRLGAKLSIETKNKISLSNLGKHYHQKGIPRTEETKRKISLAQKGKKITDLHRLAIAKGHTGLKKSIEIREKMSRGARRGENSHLWKGGVSKENVKIRNSLEYRLWREAVFKRDNWTCVFCLKRGGTLNADHIKPFAYYPELRFAIDNGRTLCVPCHKTTDTYGVNNKK